MADGGGRADDEYEVSLGGCAAGNSSQPMAQAYPDVTAQENQEPKKAPNKANWNRRKPRPLRRLNQD
jgi:hypothetical protein